MKKIILVLVSILIINACGDDKNPVDNIIDSTNLQGGSLWGWGLNERGQLGDSSNVNRIIPTRIGNSSDWISISAGDRHSLGIKKDGSLWAWGDNSESGLGTGKVYSDENKPTRIGNSSDWMSISAGYRHSLGIKKDGSLWAWGRGNEGQLGNGKIEEKNIPTQINTSTDWLYIDAANYFTFGIKKDGSLWSWGNNISGQLGNGSNKNCSSPVQINIVINYSKTSASAGAFHSLIMIKGTIKGSYLWSTGLNHKGQLGDGSFEDKNKLTYIGKSDLWQTLSAGTYYSVGIQEDGSLWAWGDNQFGQLGDGSFVDKNIPTRIGVANDWLTVSAGVFHTVGIKKDGSLWAWGLNMYGALGDGTTVNRNIPTRIGNDNDWESAYVGRNYTIALKKPKKEN